MRADEFISTNDAALHLGITRQRVLQLIKSDRLKAEKFANVYMIRRSDLAAVEERTVGRPAGTKTNGAPQPAQTTANLNKAFREAKEADQEASKITTAEKAVLKSEAPKQASKKATKKAGKK